MTRSVEPGFGNRRAVVAIAVVAAVAFGASWAVATPDAAAATPAMATPTAFEPPGAPIPPPPSADTAIKARLDQGDNLTIAGERVDVPLLRRFYAGFQDVPVWDKRPEIAKTLWGAVLRAGDQGLDPNLFHAAALANPAGLSPIDRDLLLSDAFLSYAEGLARGVMPIEARDSNEDLSPDPVDVVAVLDEAIRGPNPAAVIEALAPHTRQYAALRQAYRNYRAIAAAGGWPEIEINPSRAGFRPLQQRLADEGYLPTDYASGLYDGPTAAALRAFQHDHGLEADGVLGPATIAALDVPAAVRAQQAAINLERMRWLPHALPPTRIWVNTASAHLTYLQDGTPMFEARVVVGQSDKQTPEFASTVDGILFNPPWNVPYSITSKEIMPKLADDPDYLAQHHMVMHGHGAIEQLPGPDTALGQLKFEMQDQFDVYLHDTPDKYLFSRANRRQSHGCVRVQNPRALASLLLDTSVDTIDQAIAPGNTHSRELPVPVPVFIVYQTAYLAADGHIGFRPDTYHRDDAIWPYLVPSGQVPLAGQEPLSQRHG